MSALVSLTLVTNVVSVALSLVLLVLILWQDSRSPGNLALGGLMLMTVLWSAGAIVGRLAGGIDGLGVLVNASVRLLEIGVTGVCLLSYVYPVLLTGGQRRSTWFVAALGGFIVLAQLLITLTSPATYSTRADGTITHTYFIALVVSYAVVTISGLAVTWQRRKKFDARWLLWGQYIIGLALLVELFSPQLRNAGFSAALASFGLLMQAYATVRHQIIEPLAGRASQLQAVRDVGVAITSRLRLPEVLEQIAGQASAILRADGAAIFLNQGTRLELVAVHHMPEQFIGGTLALGEGVAGKVAASRQSQRVEVYHRDWHGTPDMPYAPDSFGSVVAAPLIFADDVVGVLFVAAGLHSKRFDRDDLRLLDLLAPQAAVAISNSRLFERRRALTDELESAKNQLETLLMSTENPVVALNRKLEVLFANFAANDLFDQQLTPGRSILTLDTQAVLPPNPLQALRNLIRWRIYTYEVEIGERTYMAHLGLLGRQDAQGYVAVLNDISQLKELDRLKNQMIRMTSHDLKNPLSAAMMNAELLLEEGEAVLDDTLHHYVSTIYTQLERMSRITRSILDLERVQSGTPAFEETSVEPIIRAAVHDYEEFARKNGVTLRATLPTELPPVMADRMYLLRALANLVENAIKFTRAGGLVEVSVEATATSLVIDVRDTGVGIPADAQPRIFDRFYRVTQPGMEPVSGTGLGLSLVKSVVDAHRGKIWLESEVGRGTVFHVALPLRQLAAADWRRTAS